MPDYAELATTATIQNMIMNGLGRNIEDYDMPKLMENLFKLNGKRWDISTMDWFLLVEIIEAHRK
jgi:hypothetical protein